MPPTCSLDATQPNRPIYSGHLRLGGANPHGGAIGVTNAYLTLNGRPFFLVAGEFHYSRYPQAYWQEALLKIKAAGVNTLSTYLFWIIHEEKQGAFDWSGQNDLRRFVELCARCGLLVILRIGPFSHGEWRNGGLPDWLYGRPFEVRSNDPGYLACVERYYAQIGRQVRGLLFGQGGPIVAVQIENEYMHAGAPWEVVDPVRPVEWVPTGRDGAAHLAALKALALDAGLDVPLYLATAWGSPILEDETLPLYGQYAYPVWVDDPRPSPYYTFRDAHARPVDRPTHRVPCYYPLAYAELQGGMQIRYHNRPLVPPRSTEAMALVAIGSGANWLGYYLFHGGTTPLGGHGFSHERLHPQLSYDYQASVGEFGDLRAGYRYLKLLHLFAQAYGESLCGMSTILPADAAPIAPQDTQAVRCCLRARDGSGFLFVNNFQDHLDLPDRDGVAFDIATPAGPLRIPAAGSLTVKRDACFILPFNHLLGGARLLYATAQPLSILNAGDTAHYFYFVPDGLQPEYCFEESGLARVGGDLVRHSASGRIYIRPSVGQQYTVRIDTAAGQKIDITTLTRHEAEDAWQGVAWGAERFIVSTAGLLFDDGQVELRSPGVPDIAITVWPALDRALAADGADLVQSASPGRTLLRLSVPPKNVSLRVDPLPGHKYQVTLSRRCPVRPQRPLPQRRLQRRRRHGLPRWPPRRRQLLCRCPLAHRPQALCPRDPGQGPLPPLPPPPPGRRQKRLLPARRPLRVLRPGKAHRPLHLRRPRVSRPPRPGQIPLTTPEPTAPANPPL